MHEEFPPVQELTVHLPGNQVVYFNPDLAPDELREKMENARSTLTAFFDYNRQHTDGRQFRNSTLRVREPPHSRSSAFETLRVRDPLRLALCLTFIRLFEEEER